MMGEKVFQLLPPHIPLLRLCKFYCYSNNSIFFFFFQISSCVISRTNSWCRWVPRQPGWPTQTTDTHMQRDLEHLDCTTFCKCQWWPQRCNCESAIDHLILGGNNIFYMSTICNLLLWILQYTMLASHH